MQGCAGTRISQSYQVTSIVSRVLNLEASGLCSSSDVRIFGLACDFYFSWMAFPQQWALQQDLVLDCNWGRPCKWIGQGVDDMQAELTGFAWKLNSDWMSRKVYWFCM